MTDITYLAIVKPEEGGFVGDFPDLPGCVSEGETIDETLDMLGDAMGGYLAAHLNSSKSLPPKNYKRGQKPGLEYDITIPFVLPPGVKPN